MARFSFFFLLTWLLAAALATSVPNPVYRADSRNPDRIKAAGGFKSFGTNEQISIIEHVRKYYEKGHRQGQDPWISTSSFAGIGMMDVVDKPCWVYTIDTSAIASKFVEAEAAFELAKEKNPHPAEKEWTAKLEIPLSSITSFYRLTKDGKKSIAYTWETWAARSQVKEQRAEASEKTSRDGIPLVKKAGTPGAAAFRE